MNSTERKQELIELLAELENNPKTTRTHDIGRHTREVLDSILFHCLKIREEIEAIRKRFHYAFLAPEIKAVKAVDIDVGMSMSSIWLTNQEWCSGADFGEEYDPYYYVKSICEELIDVITYAEEEYGVFQILDIATLIED